MDETEGKIHKTRSVIAWLERREAEFLEQSAGLPTVGFHRAAFLDLRRALKRVRRALEEEREYLEKLEADIAWDRQTEELMTPEQLASWREFEAEQERRLQRSAVAFRRRAAFRIIDGGKE